MSNTLSQQVRQVIRRSDRKAGQLLGVTLTRDPPARPPTRTTLVDALRTGFGFRLRLAKKHPVVQSSYESDQSLASSSDYYYDSESDHEDDFVWDVPNPFAPPDPSQARIDALIQAEIARMRRYEMIGPLQSLPVDARDDDWDESESEDGDGDDEDDDDGEDSDDDDADDADDEDSNDEDTDTPNEIVLPQLLHLSLRFNPSPHHLRASPSPPPPPPPSPSDTASHNPPALWADLAQVYNDIAEAEERAARKAKRDAHRSRLKALAVLGHEASSAI